MAYKMTCATDLLPPFSEAAMGAVICRGLYWNKAELRFFFFQSLKCFLSWNQFLPQPRLFQESSSVLYCATKNKHSVIISAKREKKNSSLSFFSFLARPNMLSLDRFQSCFNSLKKWNKITIYILDSWQVLCVLTAPAKSKKKKSFHSALSWIFGVL